MSAPGSTVAANSFHLATLFTWLAGQDQTLRLEIQGYHPYPHLVY